MSAASTTPSSARVMLWTSHRCVSTAFTRSMGQIPGVEVWYEPFGYAYSTMINFQLNEGVDLPTSFEGNEEIFEKASQYIGKVMSRRFRPEALSYDSVRTMLEDSTAKHVFVKDIGLAMQSSDLRGFIPKGYRHSLLIRHPLLMYSSLHKASFSHLRSINMLHTNETDEATFDLRNHIELDNPADYFRSLYELWMYIKESIDPEVIILDSSDLLANPSEMLPKYCEAVGLPYTTSMLEWKPSIDDILSWKWVCEISQHTGYIDGMLKTTGFSPPQDLPSRDTLTRDVIELADEALPFYEEMYKKRLH